MIPKKQHATQDISLRRSINKPGKRGGSLAPLKPHKSLRDITDESKEKKADEKQAEVKQEEVCVCACLCV